MKFDFEAAIDAAIQPVGTRAFHAIVKTCTDGLPSGMISLDLWKTELIAKQPTESEANAASHIAMWIEEEAKKSIIRLFLNVEFRAALTKDMQKGHARKMSQQKQVRRTSVFLKACTEAPGKPTKIILNEMQARGEIEDVGDAYLIVVKELDRSAWARISKTTMDSKLSRLKKS